MFTGREWVFEPIDGWLAAPAGPSIFLLTGKPGSGKSAIARRIQQFSQGNADPPAGRNRLGPGFLAAAHFCRANDSLSIDPLQFSRALSLQLAVRFPSFARALLKQGDRPIEINATASVAQAGAGVEVAALKIGNLVLGAATPQEAFTRVVSAPLKDIYDDGFAQPITILVDALDEALGYAGRATVVDLLATFAEPRQVRWISTSRPDPRVEERFLDAGGLALSAQGYDDRNDDDIRGYIARRLGENPALKAAAAGLDTEAVVRAADRNFLFAEFLLNDVARRGRVPDGLPFGLDALYFRSLQRVVELGTPRGRFWDRDYAPLMEVLSVARQGLTALQLGEFTGQPALRSMRGLIADMMQFLARSGDGDQRRYRLYHQSLADFLHRPDLAAGPENTLENAYYLPPRDCHGRMARAFLADERLQKPDDYAARHLSTHLCLGGEAEWLWNLVGSPVWMQSQMERTPSGTGFRNDLELAWTMAEAADREAIGKGRPPPALAVEVRCGLATASLHSVATATPVALLTAMIAAGRWDAEDALQTALQITDPKTRAEAILELAEVVTGAARSLALKTGIASARAIEWFSLSDPILTTLARRAAALRQPLEALDAARSIREGEKRFALLAELALAEPPLVPRDDAVDAALATIEPLYRGKLGDALSTLAPLLSGALLARAIDIALRSHQEIADVIASLIERVTPAEDRLPYLRTLLDRAVPEPPREADPDGHWLKRLWIGPSPNVKRAKILAAIDPLLPESLREEAQRRAHSLRDAVIAGNDTSERDEVLGVLNQLAGLQEGEAPTEPISASARIEHRPPRIEPAGRSGDLERSDWKALLTEQFAAVVEMDDRQERARAVAAFIPQPPGHEWQWHMVLDEIEAMEPGYDRSDLLEDLAEFIPDGALAHAFDLALRIDSLDALVALAASHAVVPDVRVFNAVLAGSGHMWSTARRLVRLTGSCPLTPQQSDRVFQAITAIDNPPACRTWALASLAPLFPEPRQGELLRLALSSRATRDDGARRDARHLLTPLLPDGARDKALETALKDSLDELPESSWKVRRLADHLPPDLRDDALIATMGALNSDDRDSEFAGLVEQFAGKMGQRPVKKAVRCYWYLDMKNIARALTTLAARQEDNALRAAVVDRALESLKGIRATDDYVEAATRLLPMLDQPDVDAILETALDRVKQTRSSRDLVLLVPLLTGDLRAMAIETLLDSIQGDSPGVTQRFRTHQYRDLSFELTDIALLAPHLPAEQRADLLAQVLDGLRPDEPGREVFAIADRFQSVDRQWANAVKVFAAHLTDEARRQALAAARVVSTPGARAAAIAALIPYLRGSAPETACEALRTALEALSATGDPDERITILSTLFSGCFASGEVNDYSLTLELIRTMCQEAAAIDDCGRRRNVLEGIAPHLANLPRTDLHPAWCAMLRTLAPRGRAHLVFDLAALGPVLVALGGGELVERVIKLIEELGEWWP